MGIDLYLPPPPLPLSLSLSQSTPATPAAGGGGTSTSTTPAAAAGATSSTPATSGSRVVSGALWQCLNKALWLYDTHNIIAFVSVFGVEILFQRVNI